MTAPQPRRVVLPFEELDFSFIRAHVLVEHLSLLPLPRDHRDVAWAHVRAHEGHGSIAHVHAGPDSPHIAAGEFGLERPEGWYTGRGAVDRRLWDRMQARAALPDQLVARIGERKADEE